MSVRTVILDGEAVDVLRDPRSPKHPKVLRQLQAAVNRKVRGQAIEIKVPASIRVEANWDRRDPGQAAINRFPVRDVSLDAATTDVAARIHCDLAVSLPDAHLGAVIADATKPATVLTSDIEDVTRIADYLDVKIIINRL